eukprot:31479-Pelagococcus_subviridis.AAC.7
MHCPKHTACAEGPFHTKRRQGGVQRCQVELTGIEVGDRDREIGGEKRRETSLMHGVHHANAIVWGPVYRTHLTTKRLAGLRASTR